MTGRYFAVTLALLAAAGCGSNSFDSPEQATVRATGTQISLSWRPVPGVVGYSVYRGTSPGGGKSAIATLLQGTRFSDPAAEPGTTYYYQVTALNASGDSSPSAELSASTKPRPGGTALMGGAVQGSATVLFNTVATKAGSTTAGSADGAGEDAGFNGPVGLATDGVNLYVADTQNHLIRQVVIATGAVSTLAGSGTAGSADGTGRGASFNNPAGITTDGTNLYVADTLNNLVRKVVIATGAVTTLAGSKTAGSADGVGGAASFKNPVGITTDGSNLYVADTENHSIRKVAIAGGEVTTLAGSTTSGSANGIGGAARFSSPTGVVTDGSVLYVADRGNNLIRRIVLATGAVSTLAGAGASAAFNRPSGITTDGTWLYVGDLGSHTVRKVAIAAGEVLTVAGSASAGATDGIGSAAGFRSPYGTTTDGRSLYVADFGNNTIREIY